MAKVRNTWFITRPERDPKFHPEALKCLYISTNNFSLKWKGNRDAHKHYEKKLNEYNLKRNSISNDGSGGRTWCAMLRTFGYCYLNNEGYLILTKVGEAIINGKNIFENQKKQILTLQIPNTYFLESGFRPKFNNDFSIRPVRFLIRLCTDSRLNYYLTKEEIAYFVLSAKKDTSYEAVIANIVVYRTCTFNDQIQMKNAVAVNLDHRERTDSVARDYFEANSDVAHTFMMIADFTGLAEYKRNEGLFVDSEYLQSTTNELNHYDERYPFNNRFKYSLTLMAEHSGLDIESFKASRYGNNKPMSNAFKNTKLLSDIKSNFPSIYSVPEDEFISIATKRVNKREAYKWYSEIKADDSLDNLSEEFVENYLSLQNPLDFEDHTGNIFKSIGFDVIMRPKHQGTSNTEIEILVVFGDKCGIIDAKLYQKKFNLSANLASHMATEYIREYDSYDGKELVFYGYVASNEIGGEKNLNKITDLALKNIIHREVKGFIINAKTLLSFLDYCISNALPDAERIDIFLKLPQNKIYSSFEDLKSLLI